MRVRDVPLFAPAAVGHRLCNTFLWCKASLYTCFKVLLLRIDGSLVSAGFPFGVFDVLPAGLAGGAPAISPQVV